MDGKSFGLEGGSMAVAVPVAEYVRMSTEDQKYSIPSLQAAIRQYAAEHGFFIAQSYADPGKSGLLLRPAEEFSRTIAV